MQLRICHEFLFLLETEVYFYFNFKHSFVAITIDLIFCFAHNFSTFFVASPMHCYESILKEFFGEISLLTCEFQKTEKLKSEICFHKKTFWE